MRILILLLIFAVNGLAATKKISELTEATSATDSAVVPVVDDGSTVKIAIPNLVSVPMYSVDLGAGTNFVIDATGPAKVFINPTNSFGIRLTNITGLITTNTRIFSVTVSNSYTDEITGTNSYPDVAMTSVFGWGNFPEGLSKLVFEWNGTGWDVEQFGPTISYLKIAGLSEHYSQTNHSHTALDIGGSERFDNSLMPLNITNDSLTLTGAVRSIWAPLTYAADGTNVLMDMTYRSFTLYLTNNAHIIPTNQASDVEQTVRLEITQDGTGGRTVTFDGSILWPGDTAPTMTATADATDQFLFSQSSRGNRLYASTVGQNYDNPANGLQSDVIYYWKLDESIATDPAEEEVAGLDLSDTNSPQVVVSGKIGGARSFNGSTNNRHFASGNAAFRFGDVDLSISGWVKFDALPAATVALVTRWNATGNERSYQVRYGGANYLEWLADHDGTTGSTVLPFTNQVIATNVWYHFVATHNAAANELTFVVTPESAGTIATPLTTTHSGGFYSGGTAGLYFGIFNNNGTFGQQLTGTLDEIGFFDVVLTSDQKSDLYNGGAGLAFSLFEP